MTTLTELEALAKAATPGPWRKTAHGVVCTDYDGIKTDTIVMWDDEPEHVVEDATFIAAANPATILALIALCRMQHEALLEYPVTHDTVIEALAAFENFGKE